MFTDGRLHSAVSGAATGAAVEIEPEVLQAKIRIRTDGMIPEPLHGIRIRRIELIAGEQTGAPGAVRDGDGMALGILDHPLRVLPEEGRAFADVAPETTVIELHSTLVTICK